jgi:glucokinase
LRETSIGFDIGGSTIRGGLVSSHGGKFEFLAEKRGHLRPEDREPAALAELIRCWVDELRTYVDMKSIPVGVAICAQLTDGGRHVVNSPNLSWRDVPLGDLLERALPRTRLRVTNDLNAILLGEHRFGAAKGRRDVIAVYPGTGVGGALIVNGCLVEGAKGFAGEIGHISIESEVLCGCGKTGCLETVAGGRYIESRVENDRASGLLGEWPDEETGPLRPDSVDRAYAAGVPYALSLWDRVSEELSQAISALVAFLNPELVLMGGGVIERCPNLYKLVVERSLAKAPEVSRSGLGFTMGTLGWQAGVLGAAALN